VNTAQRVRRMLLDAPLLPLPQARRRTVARTEELRRCDYSPNDSIWSPRSYPPPLSNESLIVPPEELPLTRTELCRSSREKASRDRTVFRYHSRTGLEYHFGGIQSAADVWPGRAQRKANPRIQRRSRFRCAGRRRDHNLMAPEKTRIERESARPQKGDGGSHDDQFEKGHRAIQRVPGGNRGHGKRHCHVENGNRDTCNRREESNEDTSATAGQCEACQKHSQRLISTMDQIQDPLRGGCDTDNRSHQ